MEEGQLRGERGRERMIVVGLEEPPQQIIMATGEQETRFSHIYKISSPRLPIYKSTVTLGTFEAREKVSYWKLMLRVLQN